MKKNLTAAVNLMLALIMMVGPLPVFGSSSKENSPRRPTELPSHRFVKPSRVTRQAQPRPAGESATLLPDGRWLLLGGEGPDGPLAGAEIRDERTGAIIRLSGGLLAARAWHTATVMPDGKVLVLGGVGTNGVVIEQTEQFDPETNSFQMIGSGRLTPRAFHTATVLTDGSLFVAGGADVSGRLIRKVELLDHESGNVTVVNARLQTPRRKATALLNADGTVAISGGNDANDNPLSDGEIYDPSSRMLGWTASPRNTHEGHGLHLAFSSPSDGATEVETNARIALRFSSPLQVETANSETVRLVGPHGTVPSRIVPVGDGMLLFVTPLSSLGADSSYNLSVSGAADKTSQPLPFTAVAFKTKGTCPDGQNGGLCGTAAPTVDLDSWIPDSRNLQGNWRSGRADSSAKTAASLQAASGVTALAGQVLALSGNPLANVTLQIGDTTAVTDNSGRFLLQSLQPGRHGLTIHGHSASRPGKTYGTFDVLVDVIAGKTNVLPYTVWLPVLDEQNAVSLSIPTARETAVTTPRVPGMEVRVPAGAVLRMPPGAHQMHGQMRRELTSMAITPIPVDRPPFPLPQGVNDGLLFTLQLHGARVEGLRGEKRPGLRIVFPNYQNLPAGDRVDFWNYESAGGGWHMYGHGTVSADRRQVIPDPGVELQSMYCISLMNKGDAPGLGPAAGSGATDGDPVDLGTGLFVYSKTDLVLPDVIPIALSRTYRQNDSVVRSFGKGATNSYDMYIFGDTYNYGEIILPDGGRVRFDRIPNSNPGVYEHTATPTRFYKATMTMISGVGPNGAWEVRLTDGTIYQFGIKVLWGDIFGPHSSITGLSVVQDRYGNKLTITRDSDFRMSRVTSPNGRWIQFSYSDTSKRIAQATDNTGRSVGYTYDAEERLWKVTDAKAGITEFTYDTNHRMLTIKDPRNIVYLTNEYDAASGRITRQTQADTGVYQFAYTVDAQGKITQTDVTNPRNYVRRSTFNSSRYLLTDTYALGTPQQQTYTYERQAGSNLVLSVTDPLARQTTLAYNAVGNVTTITRLAGTANAISTTTTYEPAFNQIATVTDPLIHTVTLGYDTLGRLTSFSDPLDHETTFTHNSAGQVLTATDALQQTTQFTYDSGDLVATTDPLNRTATRYVDSAGRLRRATNPLGDSIRFEYDGLNQPTSRIDPAQGVTALAYDPNGNVLSVTDARNGVTSYVYDNMDRLATRRDPLLHDETYQYDLNGNLTQVTDRKNQVTQFTYDPLNRLTQTTFADNSTITYTYDSGNRLTQAVDSISGTITYGYDNLDRLTSEITPQGSVAYTYDVAGRRTSMTIAGQPVVNYTYDDASRLTQITQGSAVVTIAYDDTDRRTSLTLPNGVVTEYGYDDASQLTGLTYKHAGNVIGDLTYEYDLNGRRTRMGGSFASSVSSQPLSSASYNAANQQLTFGSQILAYDLNGNLVSDGAETYTWDARNQLSTVSGSGVSASFQYDSRGQRVGKTVNGITTNFLYNGANIVQEQSAQTGTANILSGGIDEIFSRTDSAGSWSPLLDGLGSSLSLTDANGATQAQYTYGAFGQSTATGVDTNNSAQYTGRENDGTGLQYNRARYYSPTLQRFISEDPIGFAGGDVNLYGYVRNDPANLTDPSGEIPPLVVAGAVVLILLYSKYANAPGPNDPIYNNDPAAEMVGDIPYMVVGGIVMGKAAGMVGRGCGRIVRGSVPKPAPGGELPGLPGSAPRPLGRGSTGRTSPGNLSEQLAMEEAMSNPLAGSSGSSRPMGDPRWPANQGWLKMRQNINGHEIHYNWNWITGAVDDFKFK